MDRIVRKPAVNVIHSREMFNTYLDLCLYTPVSPSMPEMEGIYATGGRPFLRMYQLVDFVDLISVFRELFNSYLDLSPFSRMLFKWDSLTLHEWAWRTHTFFVFLSFVFTITIFGPVLKVTCKFEKKKKKKNAIKVFVALNLGRQSTFCFCCFERFQRLCSSVSLLSPALHCLFVVALFAGECNCWSCRIAFSPN